MSIPNYLEHVRAAKDRYPAAWQHAHVHGDPLRWEFIKLLVNDLRAIDPRVACNGKRGNPNDLSMDALNILDPFDGPGATPDGRRCWVVDVIAGAGGPHPQPVWNAFTDPEASSGAWVVPTNMPTPQLPDPGMHQPTPGIPQYPPYPHPEDVVDGAGAALFADFAEAGQAPNPLMFRFAFRVAYSWLTKEVPNLEASKEKHRSEWRQILGLPPVP